MRISVEMIDDAKQAMNPYNEKTINLRGNKISVIENLGITKDYFECIDLSDNEIVKLTNFPRMKKLKTLLLCNNKIARIDEDIFPNIPNLSSIVLTNNKIEKLTDLKSLFQAKQLTRLSLMDNSVTNLENYREFLIYNIPSLRYLDFQKIKRKDRENAKKIMNQLNKINDQENILET